MPWRWKRTLPETERLALEEWLRQGLQPVTPDPEFVAATEARLRDPRYVQVTTLTMPPSLQEVWPVLLSLSGSFLALAALITWLFWRRRRTA